MPQLTERGPTRETRRRREVEAAALALLLIERRNARAIKAALGIAVHQAALLQTSPTLARAAIAVVVTREILRSQGRARLAARPIWTQQTGIKLRGRTPDPLIEQAHAARAAAGIAQRWADLERRAALERDGRINSSVYRSAARETEARVDLAAETETAWAWNDELHELGVAASQVGYLVTYTWDAEGLRLGLKTCPRCAALDGMSVVNMDSFPEGWPPLHPRCHCQISTSLTRLH